jgi:putative transcriptional regulator
MGSVSARMAFRSTRSGHLSCAVPAEDGGQIVCTNYLRLNNRGGTWLMCSNSLSRLILALTAIVVSVAFLNVTPSCGVQAPVHVSLAGQLLIASPTIRDPHFDHAVILIVRHDQDGAMGIVINMPAEERPLASILEMLGEKDTDIAGKAHIFAGGPVQPEIGFVIHSADYRGPETIDINERVLMTSSSQILRDIGNNKGPKKSLIAFGYAGWAAGQLEDELQRRVWFTTAGEPKLIFDEDRKKVWESAYLYRTQDL